MSFVDPALHAPTARLDASLRVLPSEPRRSASGFPVKVHHAAAEVPGRVVVLRDTPINPGETEYVQLVLEQPLAAVVGDRFVIRDTSSSRTVGGGAIIDVRAPQRRRRTPERLAEIRRLHKAILLPRWQARLRVRPAGLTSMPFSAIARSAPPLRRASSQSSAWSFYRRRLGVPRYCQAPGAGCRRTSAQHLIATTLSGLIYPALGLSNCVKKKNRSCRRRCFWRQSRSLPRQGRLRSIVRGCDGLTIRSSSPRMRRKSGD